MAYRFEFNRFYEASPELESSGIVFDYEMSVSTETPHVASCACDGCDNNGNEEQVSSYDEITGFGDAGYVSPWPDFGAFSDGDHDRHDHDVKEDTGDLFSGSTDTIPGDSSTTFSIAVGSEASGVRNSGTDQDWFQVDLVSGQQYVFIMLRDEIDGVAGHEDPELFLFGTDGTTQLATNDDFGGRNSRITYTATEDGTFYIAADGWNTTTGGYTIYVEESTERPDFNNDDIAYFLTHQFDNFSAWDVNTTITYNVTGLEAAGQTLAHLAFDAWEDVSGLTFQSVTTGGAIQFDDEASGAFASTSGSPGVITGATINVDKNWTSSYDVNDYRYQTYLHEIGHALGLGHGGTYNGSADYSVDRVYNQDSWATTVMSYFDQGEAGSGTPRLVLGLQIADLLAIQDVYGTNAGGTRTGDTVYGANATDTGSIYDFDAWDAQGIRPPSFSIYDTDGIDTFDLSIYAANQTISLIEESFSSVGDNGAAALSNVISIARGAVIENAIGGSGDDTITGNDANNELEGNAGNDILDGGAGTDYAIYNGAQASYTLTDNGDGTWTIIGEGTDTLSNIEFARFTDGDVTLASGGGGDTNLTEGNDNYVATSGNDVINGLGGNDIIDGLTGDDVLNGGDGADRLIGGEGADALNGDAGFDSADYRGALAGVAFNVVTGGTGGEAAGDTFSGIERYYLSNFNDIITGSDANEFFFGEDGNDTINGGGGIDRIYGGEGNDIQRGQEGNDTLYGSAGNDQLNGGTGFDVANYTLATSAVVANMLTGGTGGDAAGDTYFGIEAVYGSDFDDSLTGNNSTNELRGGDGDDTLDGSGGNDRLFGGAGADILIGGTGIDSAYYTIASAGVTLDLALGGTVGEASGDTYSSIEWVFGSDFNDNITGDAGNNRLYGEDGNDTLNGAAGNDRILGGEGNDTIDGGAGVDVLFGQNGDDSLSGGAGNDFFYGGAGADSFDGGADFDTVNYLPAAAGVVVNMATGGTGGEADGDTFTSIERVLGTGFDDSLTGNADNNTLLGNGGDDYLAGGGGNDSLFGGAGVDSFGFDETKDGADVLNGFTTNEVIYLLGGDTNFDTWAEIQAAGTDAGANVIFNFGGGHTLTIIGQNLADLDASNFDFGGTPPAGEPLSDPDAFAADMIDVFDMDALI